MDNLFKRIVASYPEDVVDQFELLLNLYDSDEISKGTLLNDLIQLGLKRDLILDLDHILELDDLMDVETEPENILLNVSKKYMTTQDYDYFIEILSGNLPRNEMLSRIAQLLRKYSQHRELYRRFADFFGSNIMDPIMDDDIRYGSGFGHKKKSKKW